MSKACLFVRCFRCFRDMLRARNCEAGTGAKSPELLQHATQYAQIRGSAITQFLDARELPSNTDRPQAGGPPEACFE